MNKKLPTGAQADDAQVLTRAVTRIARLWGFSNQYLAQVLGVSEASVSRLRNEQKLLERGSKPFELAQYLVRLFRSLDALLGSDDSAVKSWLATSNLDLGDAPITLLPSISGLVNVCDYVDSYRAKV